MFSGGSAILEILLSRFESKDTLLLPSYLTWFEFERDVILQTGLEVDPFF